MTKYVFFYDEFFREILVGIILEAIVKKLVEFTLAYVGKHQIHWLYL